MMFLIVLKNGDFQSYYCSQCKEKHHIGCYCVNSNECEKNLKLNNTFDKSATNVTKQICNCNNLIMDFLNLTKMGCSVGHFDDSKTNCTCIVSETKKKYLHEEQTTAEIVTVKETEPDTEFSDSKFLYEFTAITTWLFFAFIIICCLGKSACCVCYNNTISSSRNHDNSDVSFLLFFFIF